MISGVQAVCLGALVFSFLLHIAQLGSPAWLQLGSWAAKVFEKVSCSILTGPVEPHQYPVLDELLSVSIQQMV